MNTAEQKKVLRVIMDNYIAVINKKDPFFEKESTTHVMTLLDGIALSIAEAEDENITDKVLDACKEQNRFSCLLDELFKDQPVFLYLINTLSPQLKTCVIQEVRCVINDISEVIKQARVIAGIEKSNILINEIRNTKDAKAFIDTVMGKK